MPRKNNRPKYEGAGRVKKPNLKVQAANSGLYSLRHQIIAPSGSPMALFQDALGERLGGNYNGKGFTASSLGVTVAGISEFPEASFTQSRPGEQSLTSKLIRDLLLKDYGLGDEILELQTEGLDLFTKNSSARWKSLGIFFTDDSAAKITNEKAAINDILGVRGYPRLKKYGGIASRPHVCIGTVDICTIGDSEPSTLARVLPFAFPEILNFNKLEEISPPQDNTVPAPLSMPENDAFLTGPYNSDSRYSI